VIASPPDLFVDVVRSVVGAGGAVRFRADGDSMRPTIRGGEIVTAAPIVDGRIVAGDVLLFRSAGRVLAHRVIAIDATAADRIVCLRGDAKTGCDAPARVSQIVARVVSVERNGRTIRLDGIAARLTYRVRAAVSRIWFGLTWMMRKRRRTLC